MVDHLSDHRAGSCEPVPSERGAHRMSPREVAAPSKPLQAIAAEVAFNRPANDRYRHIALVACAAHLAARPGQFFQLLCPGQGEGDHFLRRPMSVYRIDLPARRIEFLYKVAGAGTTGLARLAAGDRLDLFGPLGRGFRLDDAWRHVVLLARGVGLATLAPLAEAAVARGMAVSAILSAARPDLVMSDDYLRSVGAAVTVVTDADGSSAPERVEAVLRRLAAERGIGMMATCGSNRLLAIVQRLGRELGIPGQVAMEEHMACGIGMCFCCVRPFKVGDAVEVRRVCHDGPVFDAQEAMSW